MKTVFIVKLFLLLIFAVSAQGGSSQSPVIKVAGLSGGRIAKIQLLNQAVVIAQMENFDFEMIFEVTEFTVSATIQGYLYEVLSKSNKITNEQKDLIRKMRRGQKVYFENIKCKGPDGLTRIIEPIVFTIW